VHRVDHGAARRLALREVRVEFSMATVASSTRMPTASASPLSVMTFTVWPERRNAMSASSFR
jgi:hypothetical protein